MIWILLEVHHAIDCPNFVYPNESQITFQISLPRSISNRSYGNNSDLTTIQLIHRATGGLLFKEFHVAIAESAVISPMIEGGRGRSKGSAFVEEAAESQETAIWQSGYYRRFTFIPGLNSRHGRGAYRAEVYRYRRRSERQLIWSVRLREALIRF